MTSDLEGFEKLRSKLKTLGPRVEKKVCRRAIGRASTVIAQGIRSAAPVGDTKSIKKEVGKKVNTKKPGQVTAKIGLGVGKKKRTKGGDKKKSGYQPHGHLIAAGTQNRYTGTRTRKNRKGQTRSSKTGNKRAFRGRVNPDQFVKRGTAASQGAAMTVMTDTLRQGIEQEAKQ